MIAHLVKHLRRGNIMKVKQLSGKWKISPVDIFPNQVSELDNWFEHEVPGHWQQHPSLESHNGKVVYKKSFSLKKKKGSTYRLVLPGSFYYSTVFLNGVRLGEHEGYFAPQTYIITDNLKSKNEVVVFLDCPEEKVKNDKRMITGVFSHWDCLDPKTNPGGLWLAPYIYESKDAYIDHSRIHTERLGKDYALVRARADVFGQMEGVGKIIFTYKPDTFKGKAQKFEQEIEIKHGANAYDFTHRISSPRLWWTHDTGKPDLYQLEIEVLDAKGKTLDTSTETIGIRTFEVKDWICYLNGRRLYIKGNNYAPLDTRIATATLERAQKDVKLAIDCNMNMMRIHAHVDHPVFYEAADRAGLLVWQDFPLQWSYKKEVLPIAVDQASKMARLLYNHPSVGIWCCHNEAIYLVDTKDEDLANLTKSAFSIFFYSWNRDVMDVELLKAIASEDPSRFINRSSGEPAVFKKGGDTHFYFGWYRVQGPKRAFEKVVKYTPKNTRFVTEFGAQSLPELESCKKFMDEDINKIDWQLMQERHSMQLDLWEHWVGLNQDSLSDLVDKSQEYQSRINQYYIDRIRKMKYRPGGGVLPFMFHDPNPAVLWSIVDYWRVPKKSYYKMRDAFAPQYAFAIMDQDEYTRGETLAIPIYAVNDTLESFDDVKVDCRIIGPDGTVVFEKAENFFLPQDSYAFQVAQLRLVLVQPGTYTLEIRLSHPKFKLFNDYPIPVR